MSSPIFVSMKMRNNTHPTKRTVSYRRCVSEGGVPKLRPTVPVFVRPSSSQIYPSNNSDDNEWNTESCMHTNTSTTRTTTTDRHLRRQGRHSSSSSRWHVTPDMLRSRHRHAPPLEPCAATVRGLSVELIAVRISDFARQNSISFTTAYSTRQHCRADFLTANMLKFVVYLWRNNSQDENDDDEEYDGVIIEMQRRQGCPLEMRYTRHALVETVVTGRTIVLPEEGRVTAPPTSAVEEEEHDPVSTLLRQSSIPQDNEEHEYYYKKFDRKKCNQDAWNITLQLLASPLLDQNQLGLESMCSLTNSTIVHSHLAAEVSRALIFGQGPHGHALRQLCLKFLQDNERGRGARLCDYEDYDSDDEDDADDPLSMDYAKGRFFGMLHTLALRVLANALENVSSSQQRQRDDDVLSIQEEEQPQLSRFHLESHFYQTILRALVYNVEEASVRPQEAARSARCLFLLARLAPHVCHTSIVEDRLLPVLTEANEYGRAHHLSLERESQNLMGVLAAAY